jgi:Family of unknown function (DUF5678)
MKEFFVMAEVTLESVLEQARQLPLPVQTQLRELLPAIVNGTSAKHVGTRSSLSFIPKDRTRERQWLALHRHEYAGQWIAIEADRLIAHGEDADQVFAEVDRLGIIDPLFVHVEPVDALPFAGW